MSVSTWITLIVAITTLFATIIIGRLQIKQNNRMEDFEKRQDDRDEKRHEAEVNSQAVSYISKYYKNRGLIPLCAIAAMHNRLYYYSREMYREFCCFTPEVQNRILEYCKLDLRVVDTEEYELYLMCLGELEKAVKEYFPNDKPVFYEGGKYLRLCLEGFGEENLPNVDCDYDNHIASIISDAIDNINKKPIDQLVYENDFGGSETIAACQLVTTIAKYVAIYCSKRECDDKEYGSPGEYEDEQIEKMEDLFLKSLFEIYTNLVLYT